MRHKEAMLSEWCRIGDMKTKKIYEPKFKAQIVMKLLSGDKTLNEVAAEHQIAPSTLVEWHKAVQKDLYLVFQKQPELEKEILHRDEQIATLERKVGQLTIERDWLEKKSDELFKSQGTHRAFRIKSQSGLKHSAAV